MDDDSRDKGAPRRESAEEHQQWLQLVEDLHDRLLRDLSIRLGRHDAQDVLQEFYLRILRYKPQFEGEASTRSFLNQVLRSVVADHFRRRATRAKLAGSIVSLWDQPAADDPVDASVCDCLRGLIGGLPHNYATLIERIDLNEEPRAAVAISLGITTNNLAVRLTRARSTLRSRLLAFCTSCPIHGFDDCRCPKSPSESASA